MGFVEVKKELMKNGDYERFFYDGENIGTLFIKENNKKEIVFFQLAYKDDIIEWKKESSISYGKVDEGEEKEDGRTFKKSPLVFLFKDKDPKVLKKFITNIQKDKTLDKSIKNFLLEILKNYQ